jgi:hypothetical protein
MDIYNTSTTTQTPPNEAATDTLIRELQRLYDDTGSLHTSPAGQVYIPQDHETSLLFSPYSYVSHLSASTFSSPMDSGFISPAYYPLPTPPLHAAHEVYAWKEPVNGWTDIAFPAFNTVAYDGDKSGAMYPGGMKGAMRSTDRPVSHVCDVCFRPFKRYVGFVYLLRSSDMKRHQRTVHVKHDLKCGGCDMRYTRYLN